RSSARSGHVGGYLAGTHRPGVGGVQPRVIVLDGPISDPDRDVVGGDRPRRHQIGHIILHVWADRARAVDLVIPKRIEVLVDTGRAIVLLTTLIERHIVIEVGVAGLKHPTVVE